MTAVLDQKMERTQVFLRAHQKKRLQKHAERLGKKSAFLIRKSIDDLIEKYEAEEKKDWKKGIEKCFGMFSKQRAEEIEKDIEKGRQNWGKRLVTLHS